MCGFETHTKQREDGENGMGPSDRICHQMPPTGTIIDEVPCFQMS